MTTSEPVVDPIRLPEVLSSSDRKLRIFARAAGLTPEELYRILNASTTETAPPRPTKFVPMDTSKLCRCISWSSSSIMRENEPPPLPSLDNASPRHDDMVSVLCPTSFARHWCHETLYRVFDHQTYPKKELLVLDTGPAPSPFFTACEDPRVRYWHLPHGVGVGVSDFIDSLRKLCEPASPRFVPRGMPVQPWIQAWAPDVKALEKAEREARDLKAPQNASSQEVTLFKMRINMDAFTLGSKRNFLAAHARGSIHANFDDDDIYLPQYLERMVAALRASDAELVKLACFLQYNATTDAIEQSGESVADEAELLPANSADRKRLTRLANLVHCHRWGYGFSYVHTARLAFFCPYKAITFGEDYTKVEDAAHMSGRELKPCCAFADSVGDAVVCHIQHKANTSHVNHLFLLLKKAWASEERFNAFFGGVACKELCQAARDASLAKRRLDSSAPVAGSYKVGGPPPLSPPSVTSRLAAR